MQKDKAVVGTNNGKSQPSGNIQANFWSANKTMAGREGLPGCKYHTFQASTWGLASTCNNSGELIMGHRETTELPQRSISWSAGPGYVTFKIGGHVPITPGTICKFISTPCPQGATRATQCMWGAFISQGHIQVALVPDPQEQVREYSPIFPCLVSAKHP